jgi:hypothetical protein
MSFNRLKRREFITLLGGAASILRHALMIMNRTLDDFRRWGSGQSSSADQL